MNISSQWKSSTQFNVNGDSKWRFPPILSRRPNSSGKVHCQSKWGKKKHDKSDVTFSGPRLHTTTQNPGLQFLTLWPLDKENIPVRYQRIMFNISPSKFQYFRCNKGFYSKSWYRLQVLWLETVGSSKWLKLHRDVSNFHSWVLLAMHTNNWGITL